MFKSLMALLCAFAISSQIHAQPKNSLEMVRAACADFQARLRALYPDVQTGVAQVPKFWDKPNGETLPVFWWKRAGKDPSYPPLAYIHGGTGSNSWALLTVGKDLLDNYPGDVVSFDHRGEGCSKTLPSNLRPEVYAPYRLREVFRDLEYLRSEVFGYRKWRILGHSRGAALAHVYLESAPEGLESVHAMGFSFMPLEMQESYTGVRALGYYRVAKVYLQKYPGDEQRVAEIRAMVPQDMCWESFDGRVLCGPDVIDILSKHLFYTSSWPVLHEILSKMVDPPSIHAAIEEELKKNIYAHYNYILGTNGLDFGNPSLDNARVFEEGQSPLFTEPFLSELRYVGSTLQWGLDFTWRSSATTVRYDVIRKNMLANPGLRYFLYAGEFDPGLPLEMFVAEESKLGDLEQFRYRILEGTGHDGWAHPDVIAQVMMKTYPDLVRPRPCEELLEKPSGAKSTWTWIRDRIRNLLRLP